MCRCVYLLVLLFSIFRRGLSSSSAMAVRAGENITVHCNLSLSTEMVWFRQISDELTVIISATRGKLDNEPAVDYNKDPDHFLPLFRNVSGSSQDYSLSLIIVGIRQSDLGLYYCGARQKEIGMNFTRAVHLHFPDAVNYASESAQCWTPLISVGCALALMIALCLCVVYKRGLPSSSCVKNDDMKDSDLQYASLRHNATPRERHTPPANHSVTYDTIAKKVTKSPRV